MFATLTLLAVILAAYLLAHVVFERLQNRFLLTTGGEYILLGVLIGPNVPWQPLISSETLSQLHPILALAIGWLGLLCGMQFDVRRLLSDTTGAPRVAFVQGLVVFGGVGALTWMVFGTGWPVSLSEADRAMAAVAFGATAAVSNESTVGLVRRQIAAKGTLTNLLGRTQHLDEAVGLLAFGLLFCFFHPTSSSLERPLTPTEWFAVTIAIGIALGYLFAIFLGDESDDDKLFLALVGIIVFAAGMAQHLRLSSLVVNFVLGAALANASGHGDRLRGVLTRTRQPMTLLLLIFAGAMWSGMATYELTLAAGYVVVRLAAKMFGGALGAVAAGPVIRPDVGRGLLGHGELAVAMAINLRLVYAAPFVRWVYGAVLISVLLSELWGARSLRALLLDAGEVRHGRTSTSEEAR